MILNRQTKKCVSQALRRFPTLSVLMFSACITPGYNQTVQHVQLEKFMGQWYVIAGRFTFLEAGAHNAVETYSYNKEKNQIDISFTFNKDSLEGEQKSIPQTGWIHNASSNAHWKVSPIWPLKFDYLVLDVAEDYSWTAVGVPNQNYLWIMSRSKNIPRPQVLTIIEKIAKSGYNVNDITYVPHK